ncbi:DUF2207 family protein [Nitrolancea hollandica]|nr:TPM domain-containing protein [Nitrolancea hollandica]
MTRYLRPPQVVTVPLTILILMLMMIVGSMGAAIAAPDYGQRIAGRHVYDRAGVLTAGEQADLERRAGAVERAGAPVVVYLQARKANYQQTEQDAADLMEAWDIQSAPGAHDGLVIFLNLNPGDLKHGQFSIFAGAKHFQNGDLPESELKRISDQAVLPKLRAGDIAGGIGAALDAAAHSLTAGPLPPAPLSPVEQAARVAASGPVSLLNVLAVLLAALLSLPLVRAWRSQPASAAPSVPTTMLPGDLAPALAGALVAGRVTGSPLEATILDLARRDALAIEPVGKKKVQVRLLDRSAVQDEFEARVWDALEGQAGPGQVISSSSLTKIRSHSQPATDALREELQARGWFDPAIKARRRGLYLAGLAAILLAVLTVVVTETGHQLWGFIGMGILLIAGIVSLIYGGTMRETTAAGEAEAAPWHGYKAGLAAAKRDTARTVDLDQAMPYAVALGIATSLNKRLKAAGERGYTPIWLGRTTDAEAWNGNFYPYWVAFHTSTAPPSSSGSAGGAAAGGGGAGGGF